MMDDIGSFQDFDFVEMPQSSHSTRPIKVLARSRNTVSMSALAKEDSIFHKELAAALGNVWQSHCDLSSAERFRGFVENLSKSRSSPAICLHQKTDDPPIESELTDLMQANTNVNWNRLDDWTKMILITIIISVFMALMGGFGIL